MRLRAVISAMLLALMALSATSAPIRQMRAAWIVTDRGLDWPRGIFDPQEQKKEIERIFDDLSRANFNSVFFEMQGNGSSLWPSEILPASPAVTGRRGGKPAFDVARFVVEEAHKRGLDIFAVVKPFSLMDSGEYPAPDDSETYDYLTSLYTPLVADYDFDGIVADPLLPEVQLQELASTLYWIIADHKPQMKLLFASHSLPKDAVLSDITGLGSLIDDGWIDLIVPKLFKRDNRGFIPAIESWTDGDLSQSTVLAVTAEDATAFTRPAPGVDKQVEMSRDDPHLAGIAIYGMSSVDLASSTPLFPFPAHKPLLGSRQPTSPLPPENVTLSRDDRGDYLLSWDTPSRDASGTPIDYFTVYVARDGNADLSNPRAEIVHRVKGNSVTIPGVVPGMEFAVTTFDTNGYESTPAFSGQPGSEGMWERPDVFRYYADNLFISGPKTINSVDIYTMWGNHTKHAAGASYEISIPCGDLDGGVYVARIRYSDGSADVKKFIK